MHLISCRRWERPKQLREVEVNPLAETGHLMENVTLIKRNIDVALNELAPHNGDDAIITQH